MLKIKTPISKQGYTILKQRYAISKRGFTIYKQRYAIYKQVYILSKRQYSGEIRNSLKLASISLEALPKLTNFVAAKDFFSQKVLEGNKELDAIWLAPEPILEAFRNIFPEIVDSRGITRLQDDTFNRWDYKSNEILVELDSKQVKAEEHVEMLAIGGPCSLTASLIHKLRHPSAQIVHAVTNRRDSNHDGSAYYFHERDAFPVYINKVNRGPYCVFIDLKKRFMGPKKLLESAINDRHHVKISLNWSNIQLSMIFTIFIPNVWYMLNDLYIKNPKKTLMRHTVEHAKKTHDIIDAIVSRTSMKRESMIIQGKEKACYVGFAGGIPPEKHFKWLNKYTSIPFHVIDHTKSFGKEVQQIVNFPRDGLISPWIVENLSSQLKHMGVQLRQNFKLEKILVQRAANSLKVTKVVWKDLTSYRQYVTSVDNLVLSLGPSASLKVNLPKYSIWQHIQDVYNHKIKETYDPTIKSVILHMINRIKEPIFRGTQVFKQFIAAAGSSSVIMIGVNIVKLSEEQIDMFTKFLDGVNQHWTLIAERDVHVQSKTYRFFAIQMTGGGNFPSYKIRPDYLVNLLYTTEKMFGLNNMNDVIYDCVQSRGCGRGVSAKNSVAFIPIAKNAIAAYAQGGIGMTTMFPNGELIIQLLEHAKGDGLGKIDKGIIGNKILQLDLYSTFILEGIDYTHLVDNPNEVAKMFGWY